MGNIGWTGIIIVAALVVLLFGRGKISSIMGDVAKGIKSFKKGMATDVNEDSETKNIPENNQDTNNLEPENTSENNQDSNNKE